MRTLALALIYSLAAFPAVGAQHAQTDSDVTFASYAFANEFGSGIYDIGGRIIQIYQLPLSFQLRDPTPGNSPPGLTFLAPVTIGFFDFKPQDVLHLQVPSSIGTFSVEPGVQLDYRLGDAWRLYPYMKAGATFASSSDISAVIYGLGVRSNYVFAALQGAGLWSEVITYAGVRYRSDVPNDSFTRLRSAAELRRNLRWTIGGRALQVGPFGIVDVYLKAPTGPVSGISAETVQLTTGLDFGVDPMWEVVGFTLPRIGIGYKAAGVLSGWYLVIGDPY
jgi:hypothetical protein